MNKTVERANKIEVDFLKEEQKNMRIMFEQTARALANAIDAKDQYTHGHSVRVAEYAQKIAILYGKDEKFCSDIYYAGLLHDVGKIGVSSSIINKSGRLSDEEFTEIKKHPVIGQQILSSISKSPYLSIAAKYHHEHYDGRGYPEHLKGDDIPEIARIIAVADAYDAMTSKRSYRDPIPQQKVREEIVKGMGSQFDPQFATIMLHLIDYDTEYILKESEESISLFGKNEMHCEGYRSSVSEGLHLLQNITKIHIMCKADEKTVSEKTVPSFILFDSLDTRVHETESKRKEMFYLEYASICFNGETDCSAARKIKVEVLKASENDISMLLAEYKKGINYEIEAVKVKDHILIKISNKFQILQFIIALPDSSRYCYLAFTGEHCVLSNLAVEQMDSNVAPDFIPRIANEISFITGPTGDIPSIQIDDWRSAATEGIPVKDGMEISFHTMSLPTARLIWHCPFICLFYSDDKKVNGRNFKEFVLIRFDGENWEAEGYSKNTILINKNDSFEGWEYWKERNKKGMDCKVTINREGKRITVFTENCGIAIKSISLLAEELPEVYVALTGDQCVLTNIKVK